MLDKLLGLPAHKYLQFVGTLVLAVGLPLNKVVMSIGTIWLASNLVLKGDFRGYWLKWRKSYVFWFIVLIFMLHLLGLLYSNDLSYGLKDLKTKLPLLAIPLSLIAIPLEKKHLRNVLFGFLGSLLITSLINYFHFDAIKSEGIVLDFRGLSLFGSHIRYSLLIVMGIMISFYFLFILPRLFFLWIPLIVWFGFYTLIGQVLSGYIAMCFAVGAAIIFGIRSVPKVSYRRFILIFFGFIIFLGVYQVGKYFYPEERNVIFGDLPEFTPLGNPYYHDTTFLWFENGQHVMSFISEKEMRAHWNEQSAIPFDSLDRAGNQLKFTLMRYLSSKGYKKDREGIQKLGKEDIYLIEQGVPSVSAAQNSPRDRIVTLKNQIWNYSIGGDPDGSSLLQRVEHWKAAIHIIQHNWLFGVGTGDVQSAFVSAYQDLESKLDTEHWNRAHNQFLTIWVSFGIFAFLLFTVFWIYLGYRCYSQKNFIGLIFTAIAIGSFLSEDTLETQQGITFIALFLGLSLQNHPDSFEGKQSDKLEMKH
ncbi:MAG: O-antigen ligase family protein [Brumimicrobium sp.]|nr:O-antigen ligase family protein [Brumimicrobium sp.]